jgi:mannose/fructose/N-acetylgalactosamine-specific phosphotransferase system component IIB
VDERLIHGQVTVGWGRRLRPDRYLVIDEALAHSEFEQDLYALSVPEGSEAQFWTVQDARARIAEWIADPTPGFLLTRDLDHMLRLAEGSALRGQKVNLGGIHHREGRSPVLSYLHLDAEDRRRIAGLEAEGVEVFAQDLPGGTKTSVGKLLDG